MILEISVAIAVFIFALLAFYLIRTLIALQHTLKRIDHTLFEMELKTKNLDPLLRTLSNIGEACEAKSDRLTSEPENRSSDLTEWVLLSLKLGTNFLKRR